MKRFITIIAATSVALAVHAKDFAIDVHSHIITKDYLKALERHDALLDEGFPLPAWDADDHLSMMDGNGIGVSILTMPAPQPAWGNSDESVRIIRSVNDACSAVQRKYPSRFRFAAALPLPDIHAAIEEAVYALDSLKAVGVKLASNTRGQYLGDKALEPLMKVLDDRKATVIIHPHKPSPVNDNMMKALPLAAYEYRFSADKNLYCHENLHMDSIAPQAPLQNDSRRRAFLSKP